MVCYIVPLGTALIGSGIFKLQHRAALGWWLLLMLYGGAIFGVVDHLWHGELFLISEQPQMDLLLGAAITAAIFAGWGAAAMLARASPEFGSRVGYPTRIDR